MQQGLRHRGQFGAGSRRRKADYSTAHIDVGYQRRQVVAKLSGLHGDGKPAVLFLWTHNAGRSQMALGFFEALTGDYAVAWSGGSKPGHEVNPAGLDTPAVHPIRDDIARQVRHLIDELALTPAADQRLGRR